MGTGWKNLEMGTGSTDVLDVLVRLGDGTHSPAAPTVSRGSSRRQRAMQQTARIRAGGRHPGGSSLFMVVSLWRGGFSLAQRGVRFRGSLRYVERDFAI